MTRPLRRLLHLGNVVIDVVLAVPALPERGGDVLASASRSEAGGGFNVMAAAARQGMAVRYAGAHGSGPFADLARDALAHAGIEVLQPAKLGTDTGFVVTIVDAAGERTFLTSPGAEATLTSADLTGVRAVPGEAVYLSGYSLAQPGTRAAVLDWLSRLDQGSLMFFDPGPLAPGIPAAAIDAVLARADWLTCNAAEALALAGPLNLLTQTNEPAAGAPLPSGSQVLAALGALIERAGAGGSTRRAGRRCWVLVRTGRDGCLLGRAGTAAVHVPGFGVEAVDTNGAGDAHTGTLLAALAAGAAEPEAARIANAAAALSVTRRGPAAAPTAAELARFLAAAAGSTPGSPGITSAG